MATKAWGKGSWAADVEAEELEIKAEASAASLQSYPSLKEAASAKPKKKKKQAMTLSELNTGVYVGPGGGGNTSFKGFTSDEMLRLPTGPKERSAEELEHGRLGGGFRNYGGGRDRGGDGGGGGRRQYGGFDDDRRAPSSRVSELDQPSRADEVDNWATMKKALPLMDSGRRGDRYSSLGSGGGGESGFSRADDVDNWTVGKKSVVPVRGSSFGSGFKERDSTLDYDRWSRGATREGGDRERPRLVFDKPRGEVVALTETVKSSRPSPFGAARPREEVLTEKGVDWRKMESETGSNSSRPSSSHSSRPQSPATQVLEVAPRARPKVNPFGDAKPREVLLQEQGRDWRKIDLQLEHRGVDRPDTEEEKMLKEEIDNLKKKVEKESALNANGQHLEDSIGKNTSLQELIIIKERDLELLICELDNKVRFVQRGTDRPGSGAGRVVDFPERLSSQSNMSEEANNMNFMDRPPSRGTRDAWARSGEDRRAFQGGRGGFSGNVDRSRASERW
ncbi:hypothetical protein GIB67_004436 [Kingdonia uniflora]|uniref:Uncharacterized protein n=1 Tax=Kingdonia uniflora TaxID=39325 RepID=A0A7J7MS22_9MAGN|nr:hypothetical protein GIB67_004436 [Kingdonia uniflora]